MQREIIERLAMDRALGELTEDAATLFEIYLQEHPEAGPWAGQMAQTCDLTRRTIEAKTQAVKTPCTPVAAGPGRTLQMNWLSLGRWAAVIAVALLIGAGLGRWSKPVVVISRNVAAEPQASGQPEGWARVLSQPEEGFWQAKAVAMLETKPHAIPNTGHAGGDLWDKYRRFTKERRYE